MSCRVLKKKKDFGMCSGTFVHISLKLFLIKTSIKPMFYHSLSNLLLFRFILKEIVLIHHVKQFNNYFTLLKKVCVSLNQLWASLLAKISSFLKISVFLPFYLSLVLHVFFFFLLLNQPCNLIIDFDLVC